MRLSDIRQLTDNLTNLNKWKQFLNNSSLEELKSINSAVISRLPKEFQYYLILEKLIKIYNNRYDYSQFTLDWFIDNFGGSATKIPIICPIHGLFYQRINDHLNNHGCPKCAKNRKLSYQDFIRKATKVHNNLYNYSFDNDWWCNNYRGMKSEVPIICPQHGLFYQKAENHLKGLGCPECANNKKLSYQDFISKATKIHKNRYQYPFNEEWWQENYKNKDTKVPIICPQHGEFMQGVGSHLSGKGCLKCGYETMGDKNRLSYQEFIEKATQIHGNKYIYPSLDWWKQHYRNSKEKVSIICPQHGLFHQQVNSHLQGEGCPKCGNTFSNGEEEIRRYIESFGFNTTKYKDSKYEIDIFIPELNIGFEFNGIRWHSDQFKHPKYHQEKSLYFAEKGIKLVHIWEDWWLNKRDLVFAFIRNQLGKSKYRVYARKCEIRQLKYKDVKDFLDRNHFQGTKSSNLYYGLFYQDKLIQVLTFIKKKDYWEIDRFATERNYSVVGGFSKLFKHFLRENNPDKIITFSAIDLNNLETDSVYYKAGFKLISITDPSYFYISPDKTKRYSRNHFQKHKLLNYDYLKPIISKVFEAKGDYTEREIMDLAGWYRVYNSGNFKWEWEG